ncbi:GNAT family N-acetyltransferase [Micromonospora sp. STR1s_6]|uniref:GNAT family N-acetyltransferase n=2 Tax=Micromonospora tarensis TaxID=2806100 RepID=A0ABS1YA99_9ACTN|nr:GNAT family N-acetyltransferase [Micromonospora tarensis]
MIHAASWRRFYRGAYSDAFLDGDVESDRRAVWARRLAAGGGGSATIMAYVGAETAGFVHVVFDDDEQWGALVDNLHVVRDHQRRGIGASLIASAARAVLEHGAGVSMYLWVLEQNVAAQAFYTAQGGRSVERAMVDPPGGDPERLAGTPAKLRYVWPDLRDRFGS